tara:strand:- start:1023 stop:1157 length:135 start_codon:yes stop_codon:yes gene_type:complete
MAETSTSADIILRPNKLKNKSFAAAFRNAANIVATKTAEYDLQK